MAKKPFCVHPFIRHYVDTTGTAELCCESQRPRRQADGATSSWLSPHLESARNLWRKGQWPSECHQCRDTEQQGGRSLRETINQQYAQLHDWWRDHPEAPISAPVAYDLRLNNTCNLACVMCGPEYSSLHHALSQSDQHMPDHTDDLIREIMANQAHTQHLQIAGGEPFLMPGVERLITAMAESGHSEHCDLEITTNGTHIKQQWLQAVLPRFRSCELSVSCDAVGDRAEYVRWPLRWHRWLENWRALVKWSDLNDHCAVTLGVTVSAVTVGQLRHLHEWHHAEGIPAYYDVVRSPQWLRPSRVTPHIKQQVIEWIDQCDHRDPLQQGLTTTVRSAILEKANHQPRMIHAQQEGIRYLNAHRPITWAEAIPELRDWQPPQQ